MPTRRMLHFLNSLCGLGLSLICAQALAEDNLLIGVSDTDSAPLVVLADNGKIKGGIIKAIGDRIALALQAKPQYIVVSRNRVEVALDQGKVDMVCNANPEWYSNAAQLGWTLPLYDQTEIVVTRRNIRAPIETLSQLAGQRIGVIYAYHYPSLEPIWRQIHSSRAEYQTASGLLRALLSHKVDVAITSQLEYWLWQSAHSQRATRLKVQSLEISNKPTMCALSPKSRFSLKAINQAIFHLKRTGQLQQITHAKP